MKMLAVVLLAGLCCGVAADWPVSRCDLYWKLKNYVKNTTVTTDHSVLRDYDVLAQIVCHVTKSSNYNYTAVTQMVVERDEHHSVEHHGRRQRRHDRRPSKARPKPPSHHPRPDDDKDVWTLYGIYQLGNRLVCDDGVTPSLNICDVDCGQLLLNDIRVATQCLGKILTYNEQSAGRRPPDELKIMMKLLFQDQCDFGPNYFYCPMP